MQNERRPPHGPRRPGQHGQDSQSRGPQGRGPQRPGGHAGGPQRGGPLRGGARRSGPARSAAGRSGANRPRRRFEAEEAFVDDDLSGPIEADYLKTLVAGRAPVEVHLRNGQTHSGMIEYYDQRFIRLTPQGASNKFIFKHDIKYLLEK